MIQLKWFLLWLLTYYLDVKYASGPQIYWDVLTWYLNYQIAALATWTLFGFCFSPIGLQSATQWWCKFWEVHPNPKSVLHIYVKQVVSCHRSSGRCGPSCLAGHVSTDFVPGLRHTAWLVGRFSCRANLSSTPCRASPRPIKLTTTHFYQYFHQLFIIFTIITINNTYIQITTTSKVYFYRSLLGGPLERAKPMSCRVPRWQPRHGLVPRVGPKLRAMGRAAGCMAIYSSPPSLLFCYDRCAPPPPMSSPIACTHHIEVHCIYPRCCRTLPIHPLSWHYVCPRGSSVCCPWSSNLTPWRCQIPISNPSKHSCQS
jgi:hypothetical protein